MATDQRWHLVCYDVRDPKRLRRAAKLVEGYGTRLQYSVFRCRLTPCDCERLRYELRLLLELEDSVLIIPLCGRCEAKVASLGKHSGWTEPPPRVNIL